MSERGVIRAAAGQLAGGGGRPRSPLSARGQGWGGGGERLWSAESGRGGGRPTSKGGRPWSSSSRGGGGGGSVSNWTGWENGQLEIVGRDLEMPTVSVCARTPSIAPDSMHPCLPPSLPPPCSHIPAYLTTQQFLFFFFVQVSFEDDPAAWYAFAQRCFLGGQGDLARRALRALEGDESLQPAAGEGGGMNMRQVFRPSSPNLANRKMRRPK